MYSRRGAQRGQALAEFALVSVVLALFLACSIEFGLLYGHKLELANSARTGARWGAAHSTTWTNAASPASNTIEGQVLAGGGTGGLPNDDSHIVIEYFDTAPASPVLCGKYSQARSCLNPAIPTFRFSLCFREAWIFCSPT